MALANVILGALLLVMHGVQGSLADGSVALGSAAVVGGLLALGLIGASVPHLRSAAAPGGPLFVVGIAAVAWFVAYPVVAFTAADAPVALSVIVEVFTAFVAVQAFRTATKVRRTD